jgi:RimJ/RimL family protein N-acetyltransferase
LRYQPNKYRELPVVTNFGYADNLSRKDLKLDDMTDWITHPVIMKGEIVRLLPLEEIHFDSLIEASQDKIIWTYMGIDGTEKSHLRMALEESLTLRDKKEQYPFVIVDTKTNKIIGSTRFIKLTPEHRKLEIGWTWIHPAYWSKGYNEECKLLQMTYCFEVLKTIRVEILTWDKNVRSRKAIERIGGKFEGILRNNIIRKEIIRNTAVFSVIESEWEETKMNLIQLLQSKKTV